MLNKLLDSIKFHKRERLLVARLSNWINTGDEIELAIIRMNWSIIPKWEYYVSKVLSYIIILDVRYDHEKA